MSAEGVVRRRLAAGLGAIAAVLTLTACTSAVPNASDPTTTTAETPATQTPAADPTCETIIDATLVEEFGELGWTAQQSAFNVGPNEIADGIVCTWGDYSGTATDLVQMYGWAPLDDAASTELQEYLVGEGWKQEDGDGISYITENDPPTGWTDDDGYGMTYAFGDGWVTLADTRQGLGVIIWTS